jgi:hypothetical protein
MSRSRNEERFSDDLQEVADVLCDQRPALTPLELDRVKLRAMSGARRSTSSREKGSFMRTRLTTLLTVGFLTVGTGGALATFDGGDFGSGHDHGGSAGFHEYRCDRNQDSSVANDRRCTCDRGSSVANDTRCTCDRGSSVASDGRCHGRGGDKGGDNKGRKGGRR